MKKAIAWAMSPDRNGFSPLFVAGLLLSAAVWVGICYMAMLYL